MTAMRAFNAWTMALSSMLLVAACEAPQRDAEPHFTDVVSAPPITNPATPEWLVTNDRPLAVWIEGIAQACDRYGCAR